MTQVFPLGLGVLNVFMPLADPQPATSLSHRLGLTLAGLCEALAARMAKAGDRTAGCREG
ncbi:MAG: hypothetical protein JO110_14225 [Acetobacteraceae bacterium]|nr:hypothetical protein [Acetobacteraceae bacterium]